MLDILRRTLQTFQKYPLHRRLSLRFFEGRGRCTRTNRICVYMYVALCFCFCANPGLPEGEEVKVPSVSSCHQYGHVISFRATVYKVTYLNKKTRELFCSDLSQKCTDRKTNNCVQYKNKHVIKIVQCIYVTMHFTLNMVITLTEDITGMNVSLEL